MKVAVIAEYPTQHLPGFPIREGRLRHHHTWLPQIANGLQSHRDLEVHWIGLHPDLQAPCRIDHLDQSFHYLPTPRHHRISTLFREDRRNILSLLDEIQPDVVHGWGTEDVHGRVAVESGLPALVSMQGIMSYYARHTRVHPRDYLCALLECDLLGRASHISCESRWAMRVLEPLATRATFHHVEYGVDPRFFDIPWKPCRDHKVALFVGTLNSRKGIQDLVRAWSRPELRDVELRVCGGGAGRFLQRLKDQAPGHVRWLGYLDRDATAREMSRAWCLMLPTRGDTSPNVVKEARVIGMPVITTPRGGQSDYIHTGRNGFLVQPGDIDNLVHSAKQIFEDLDRCRELGAWHHEEQRDFFRPERTAKAFAGIYRELVE